MGQGGGLAEGNKRAPANRGGLGVRCRKVFAKGRAQSRFEARIDADLVDHRRPFIGVTGFQNVGKGLFLGEQAGQCRLGGMLLGNALGNCFGRIDAGLFSGFCSAAGIFSGRLLAFQGGFCGTENGGVDGVRFKALALRVGVGGTRLQAFAPVGQVLHALVQTVASGFVTGEQVGKLGQHGIQLGDAGVGLG